MKFYKNGLEFITYNKSNEQKEFIKELTEDKDIRKNIPKITSKIKKINTDSIYENGYIVRDTETNEFIGFVYLGEPYQKEADINYAVHPNYRLQGYGKRILKASSGFILEKDQSIENIALIINPDNYASKRVAESVGFSQDGNIRYTKKR